MELLNWDGKATLGQDSSALMNEVKLQDPALYYGVTEGEKPMKIVVPSTGESIDFPSLIQGYKNKNDALKEEDKDILLDEDKSKAWVDGKNIKAGKGKDSSFIEETLDYYGLNDKKDSARVNDRYGNYPAADTDKQNTRSYFETYYDLSDEEIDTIIKNRYGSI